MTNHILIVDDEPVANAFLADYLHELGYDVASAYDGAEALDLMRSDPPALAVIDLQMPGMGGWELVRQIRADHLLNRVPILVCTGHKDARLPAHLVQGFLVKPFELEELARQTSAALAGSVR
jgi:CheY-like chemotaxis protein